MRRTRRSSVPWRRESRVGGSSLVDILPEYETLLVECQLERRTRSPYSESVLGALTRSQDSESLLGVPTRSQDAESGLGVPLHRCRSGSSRNVNRRLRRFTALHDRCGGEVARDIEHRAEHVRNRIDRNEYPDPLSWKTNRDEERREH